MKIGLMGLEFESPNKGCEALVYSFLSIIIDALDEKTIIYNFSGTNLGVIPKYFDKIKFVNIKPKIKDIKFKYVRAIKKCDYIFDATMGDGFSDIYSEKYCNSLIRRKRIAEYFCDKYILLPQTYGPFENAGCAKKAREVFKKAYKIYCRDELSQQLLKEKYNIKESVLVSDMAFILPYDKNMYRFDGKNKLGINISGLLYKGGFHKENQFGLALDYRCLIDKLLSTLTKKYEVHLIPHVVDLKEFAHDDDYKICKELHEKYPDTVLAPAFVTPIEAKSYISNMNVFVGARMHSTIAAFSSGVATIPISYSRKFEGLFGSLNYPYVINAKEENTNNAYNLVVKYLENIEPLINAQKKSLECISEKNELFKKSIVNVIKGGRV